MQNNKLALVGALFFCLLSPMTAFSSSPQDQEIRYSDLSPQDKKQVKCLAKNIYFEAKGESRLGQIAVANVTLNRVMSEKFADSVCGVVYERSQFSWVKTTKRKKSVKMDEKLFQEILELATVVYLTYDPLKDVTRGATRFHAKNVHPKWKDVQKTAKIGGHVFYRERPIRT